MIRAFVTFVAAVATFFFVYWVPFSLILSDDADEWIPLIGSLVCALAVGCLVWRRATSVERGFIGHVVRWAFVVGGFGFVAGFFGPMVITPGANQGPLLGLFITGPLGFLLGGIGGAIRWWAGSTETGGSQGSG
jgi:hypothetical protein